MIPVTPLRPFTRFLMTIGEIPTSYLISMTYEEQLLWLCNYLEKTVIPAIDNNAEAVKELQDLFVELKSYVDNYFDNLDVQEEINNKLDEMATDGTLDEIINQEIFSELNEKIESAMLKTDNQSYNNLTLERFLRYFVKSPNNPDYDNTIDYHALQGGCYTGNDKMIIVRMQSDNNTILQEISLVDGSVIRSANISLGHGNSITYNPSTSKLYITGLTGDDKHKIFVVNYTSFTLENTLIFDTLGVNEGIHSVSYDIEDDKYYIMTETSPTNYLKFYELNITDSTLTEITLENYDNTLTTTNTNDMLVYNKIIYIMKHSPQVVITYNIENQQLQNLYNISEISSAKSPTGDLENISIMYDKPKKDLLIASNKEECKNGFYNIYQFFKANPVYNVKNNEPLNNNNQIVLFVNINSNATNPDGTENNKFKYISEAIDVAKNTNARIEINVASGTYPYLYITDLDKVVNIYGVSNPTISGAYISHTNNIYFSGFTFSNTLASQTVDLYLFRCYIKLSNSTMSITNDVNIYLHNSTINLFNTNAIFHSQAENVIICNDATPTYKIKSGSMPSINKPVKLFNGNISSTSDSTTYDLSNNNVLKNCNTLLVSMHGNYSYTSMIFPNITSDGFRLSTCCLNQWLMVVRVIRSGNTYSLKTETCKSFASNNVVDNTSSATGDFVVYAMN